MTSSSQPRLAAHAAVDATVTLGMLTTAAAQPLQTTSVTSLPAGPMNTTASTTMKSIASHAGTSTSTLSIISRMLSLIVSMRSLTEASINLQVNATGTGDANTGAVTSTTAISLPKTTVAHAVVDATVTPMIQTAVAYKKMAQETQRPSILQDVLSVSVGTMT